MNGQYTYASVGHRPFGSGGASVRRTGLLWLIVALALMGACRRYSVSGTAANYKELKADGVPQVYLKYFSPKGTNFRYWYQPDSSWGSGEYEIGEGEFLEWAEDNGWKVRRVSPDTFVGSIQLVHRGPNEYVHTDDGYWYKELRRIERWIDAPEVKYLCMYYDISDGKCYVDFEG